MPIWPAPWPPGGPGPALPRWLRPLGAAAAALAGLAGRAEGGCACMYQSSILPSSIWANYPSSDPGKYQNYSSIGKYGTMCAAWDTVPGTPWEEHCPASANFADPVYNWCQAPWCYVDASCDSKIASVVFTGSDAIYYSYDACGAAPDCYVAGPGGPNGRGTPGCPYDPHFESTHRVYKSTCACKYHGMTLPTSLYHSYPLSDPGKHRNELDIEVYGTTCAAWDQSPNTPWYSFCPPGVDWCTQAYNWCQEPWCYVDESCPSKIPSSVFEGSNTTYYSYDTCLSAPDCFTNSQNDTDWVNLPASCPYDSSDANWATALDCPGGWRTTSTQPDLAQQDTSGAVFKAMPASLALVLAAAAVFALGA